MVKRFQLPALSLEELPKIDIIVISHDHYDHLDAISMKFFADKDVQFLTPLGVGSHLVGWGIARERITELDWWESHKIADIEFTATPAQHFSGRSPFDENKTLWASWVIHTSRVVARLQIISFYSLHSRNLRKHLLVERQRHHTCDSKR